MSKFLFVILLFLFLTSVYTTQTLKRKKLKPSIPREFNKEVFECATYEKCLGKCEKKTIRRSDITCEEYCSLLKCNEDGISEAMKTMTKDFEKFGIKAEDIIKNKKSKTNLKQDL
ncbi:hemopexin domain-containing protein [Anaeramoeba flamelloides]|uniref:Hemopexin domain-containing protein n=1 Tax=Anaeramoeba flamelloides TaxID=1746091 RepID=A0AAV7ZC22_9EUKA|nr:hemopexin domain-containing protein [Anaeramoeba flamelloides]KAJ6240144.1 hemopexin domain-containing protein [Anaeramoeba flamelloides]